MRGESYSMLFFGPADSGQRFHEKRVVTESWGTADQYRNVYLRGILIFTLLISAFTPSNLQNS
jgi:hypothetical protein